MLEGKTNRLDEYAKALKNASKLMNKTQHWVLVAFTDEDVQVVNCCSINELGEAATTLALLHVQLVIEEIKNG
jgi:hypothetical protein